jgi:4-hydroxybenzoate decarboxylase subunit C
MSRTGCPDSTRAFVTLLKAAGELWVLEDPVDPNLELAQIQREICRRRGPAILFTQVKGTRFQVATNLYGSPHRLALAFGDAPASFIQALSRAVDDFLPPSPRKIWAMKHLVRQTLRIGLRRKRTGPVLQRQIDPVDLQALPLIKSWPEDGGAFITLPLVYTEGPISKKGNLGMYRVQLHDRTRGGMHIQIHRGGGYHYHEAERTRQSLPVRIFIGGSPALTIAAIAPLPEDVPELLFASLLAGRKLTFGDPDDHQIRLLLEADFSIQGIIPPFERMPEGPFGDHYGYYSLRHDYPFFVARSLYHRADAIYPATVVGRPPQEDHTITEFLQELLEPLFPLVMPNVKKVWAYEESGVHSLAGAVVENRYPREAFIAALRILGEGQLSLTKCLLVTDQPCELKDFKHFLQTVLERANVGTDLHILSPIAQDTLDYTGPRINEGSKAILMGLGEKKRSLPTEWRGQLSGTGFGTALLFCPGVLCVKGTPYRLKPDLATELVREPDIHDFAWVVLLDDPQEACRSNTDFLWHVFTRFEPAADIYGEHETVRLHIAFTGPIVIDCRMKPWYPPALTEDPEVADRVHQKWGGLIDRVCSAHHRLQAW